MTDDAWAWLNHPSQGPLEWHRATLVGTNIVARRFNPDYWLSEGDLAAAARACSWFPTAPHGPMTGHGGADGALRGACRRASPLRRLWDAR